MDKKFTITTPYTFAQLCNNLQKFKIPPYQRTYSWKPKQINELWESVLSSDLNYFIGNMVLLEPSIESEGRYEVIDGQQRLFTLSLLLAVLRNEYMLVNIKDTEEEEWKRKRINDIDDKMLYYKEDKYPFKVSLRILPGKSNLMEVYEKIIKNDQDVFTQKNLDNNQIRFIANYKILKKLVDEYIWGGKKLEKLDELLEKVSALLFIVIVCSSDNDAYEIFEGLNSTGIDLTVSDLVKNAVMQAAKTASSRITAEGKWNEMEALFEATSITMFPKFLRHQWISTNGYITGNKLFGEIKKSKLKNKDSYEIVDYIEELLDDAKLYVGFRDSRFEGYLLNHINQSTLDIIKNFRLLDIEQVYEIMLAYLKKKIKFQAAYQNKFLNRDLRNLWIFAFKAKILSLNPSDYERKFAEHCETIKKFKGNSFDDMSKEFNSILYTLTDDNVSFASKFSRDLEYTTDSSLIRFILEKLMSFSDREILFNKPTIEHILPQEPSKWKLTKENVKDYVEKIGNLTILHESDNSSAGNETFKYKYENVYSKSKFTLNIKLNEWEEKYKLNFKNAIEERGLFLAEEVNKMWVIK